MSATRRSGRDRHPAGEKRDARQQQHRAQRTQIVDRAERAHARALGLDLEQAGRRPRPHRHLVGEARRHAAKRGHERPTDVGHLEHDALSVTVEESASWVSLAAAPNARSNVGVRIALSSDGLELRRRHLPQAACCR